ncbi:hypothetical protein U9M48_002656 [Paspalum notatum var. saurae]|uniref:Uncharacterized protein n=1 Tax=Paspalum notatum var. saurae TaxID=547442 RepID=A0AAQ3SHL5_PASNO
MPALALIPRRRPAPSKELETKERTRSDELVYENLQNSTTFQHAWPQVSEVEEMSTMPMKDVAQ